MKAWSYVAMWVLVLVATGAASDCDCDVPPLPKALDRSAAVFTGRVVRVTPHAPNQVRVLFRTDQWWKGRPEEQVVVTTARDGASCGYAFQENVEYLVYVERYQDETQYSTNTCTRTRPWQGSTDEQRALTSAVTELTAKMEPNAATAARFRLALTASGPHYEQLRTALLARPNELRPLLDAGELAADWRVRTLAAVLEGWLEHHALFELLWNWEPVQSRRRNAEPEMNFLRGQKFHQAGGAAIPIMLERIWKHSRFEPESLPQVLAERNAELMLPVTIDWIVRNRYGGRSRYVLEAMGKFGARATPLLIEALETAPPTARGALVEALGATGDPNAAPQLLQVLSGPSDVDARGLAAAALVRLGRLDLVRRELPKIRELRARLLVLDAFGADTSPEGHRFLERYAATSAESEERLTVVKTLFRTGAASAGRAIAALATREPDPKIRASMFVYLGGFPTRQTELRTALLQGLKDPELPVRARAAEGLAHYPSAEVLRALTPLLRDEGAVRDAAAFSLRDWDLPGVSKAFVPLLKSESPTLRGYALHALLKNPVPEALDPLIALLASGDASLRRGSASALGALGSQRALPALRQAEARESDDAVREAIRTAIQKLGGLLDPEI